MSYDDAEYYDCRDSEEYTCDSPGEAIAEWLECFIEPGCDVVKLIAARAPIKVSAYKRDTLPENWYASQASSAVESVLESFHDEFGNPNDDDFPASRIKNAEEQTEAVLRMLLQDAVVWSCEKCGERTYSVAEVEALMRDWRPDWFTP